jgi:hypothetical protein
LFLSLQNSEGCGNSDSSDSCADTPQPPIFTISEGQNLTYSLSPSLLRFLAKNLQKTKMVAWVNVKKIEAKNI